MHIRTRNDLISWLEENAPRRAIARALQEGQVENLGVFFRLYPSLFTGWIIKVESRHKKIWYVVIRESGHEFIAYQKEKVPWKYWAGDKFKNKLHQGDKPKKYKRLRNKEL